MITTLDISLSQYIWFELLVPEEATTERENVSTFEQMTLSLHTKIFSRSREWSERYEAIWDDERKHP
ncbi:hypothetical protein NC651_000115 [Populus alba x Populus x berolinensis]|nr:hypothetical protein NC651_000115 [Populus alba x Populus x berolinensis]